MSTAMTAGEIEAALIAKGVPADKARRQAWSSALDCEFGQSQESIPERRQDIATVTLPFRLVVPWSLLCSDNDKEEPYIAHGKDGKMWPRKRITVRYRTAKNAICDKAKLIVGESRPTIEPLSIRVEVWLPPARRNDAVNFAKVVGDSLEKVVYANDNQLHRSTWIRAGIDIDAPRAEITITPLAG